MAPLTNHPTVRPQGAGIRRLVSRVRWGLRHELPTRELRTMLEQLEQEAERNSREWRFAARELARILVVVEPWRAAVLLRRALAQEADGQLWGLLGIAHTQLGNYRLAVRAYLLALRFAPDDISHQHNLGHLLDVGLNQPRAGLTHLRAAYRACPGEPELAGSLAHALLRTGDETRARAVMLEAIADHDHVELLLRRWKTANPPGSLPGPQGALVEFGQ